MKLAVVGSRCFTDYNYLAEMLDTIHVFSTITLIVSGGADGADKLAECWADKNGVEKLIIKPDWDKHGKRAGFIRNVEIWNNSDEGIAFWDGQSKGTAHSFDIAKNQNKKITICVQNCISTTKHQPSLF
jgi:hypothetical protein